MFLLLVYPSSEAINTPAPHQAIRTEEFIFLNLRSNYSNANESKRKLMNITNEFI